MPAVVVQATLGMAGAIIGEAALSFLGPGRPAADAQLGHDAERRPGAPARCAAPHRVPRAGDRAAGARVQLSGDGLHDATEPRKQLRIWNLEFGIWNLECVLEFKLMRARIPNSRFSI